MVHVQSSVTDLPRSCKSAAERMAQELSQEDKYADLTDSCLRQISDLERSISKKTGEDVALVAYRV